MVDRLASVNRQLASAVNPKLQQAALTIYPSLNDDIRLYVSEDEVIIAYDELTTAFIKTSRRNENLGWAIGGTLSILAFVTHDFVSGLIIIAVCSIGVIAANKAALNKVYPRLIGRILELYDTRKKTNEPNKTTPAHDPSHPKNMMPSSDISDGFDIPPQR